MASEFDLLAGLRVKICPGHQGQGCLFLCTSEPGPAFCHWPASAVSDWPSCLPHCPSGPSLIWVVAGHTETPPAWVCSWILDLWISSFSISRLKMAFRLLPSKPYNVTWWAFSLRLRCQLEESLSHQSLPLDLRLVRTVVLS